jgi:hypothetical protein
MGNQELFTISFFRLAVRTAKRYNAGYKNMRAGNQV